jgi:hypothetical protein
LPAENEGTLKKNGIRIPHGTNIIFFVDKSKIPADRKVTYGQIVCLVRPQKQETHRTRLTVGGNLIDYPFDVSTPTAGITTAKILFNSVVLTPNAKFMGLDIKDFYLNTEMDRYEYMWLPIDIIPQERVNQYNLLPLVNNGFVYIDIQKGMYGLPQAGLIANKKLRKHLATWFGYIPTTHTPGLWKHTTCPTQFSLVIDDFGVKQVGKENAQRLINTIKNLYDITTYWDGTLYCGITLKWDYLARSVNLSMPGYIAAALHKFQPLKNLDTPNQPCQSKPTTPLPLALQTIPSNNASPTTWTCASTGYATTSRKTNSSFIGNPEPKTTVTISRNTSPHCTIA